MTVDKVFQFCFLKILCIFALLLQWGREACKPAGAVLGLHVVSHFAEAPHHCIALCGRGPHVFASSSVAVMQRRTNARSCHRPWQLCSAIQPASRPGFSRGTEPMSALLLLRQELKFRRGRGRGRQKGFEFAVMGRNRHDTKRCW